MHKHLLLLTKFMAKFLQNLFHRTLPPKIRNNAGQHSIEYAVVLIVVMAAIIIAGRYVIRSWNANMKSWEDQAIDSMLDPMMPAPNINLGPCNCSLKPAGCGPLGGCQEDQQFNRCECKPLGCGMGNPSAGCGGVPENSGTCTCDITCCTVPVPTGVCGPPACPDFMMQATFECGCGAMQTGCINHPDCRNECIPPIQVPLNSLPCPGYQVNLPGDINNVLVDVCSGAPEGHCELHCKPPYWPDVTHTQCGLCPPGFVLQGACGAGECETPMVCPVGMCSAG